MATRNLCRSGRPPRTSEHARARSKPPADWYRHVFETIGRGSTSSGDMPHQYQRFQRRR